MIFKGFCKDSISSKSVAYKACRFESDHRYQYLVGKCREYVDKMHDYAGIVHFSLLPTLKIFLSTLGAHFLELLLPFLTKL